MSISSSSMIVNGNCDINADCDINANDDVNFTGYTMGPVGLICCLCYCYCCYLQLCSLAGLLGLIGVGGGVYVIKKLYTMLVNFVFVIDVSDNINHPNLHYSRHNTKVLTPYYVLNKIVISNCS